MESHKLRFFFILVLGVWATAGDSSSDSDGQKNQQGKGRLDKLKNMSYDLLCKRLANLPQSVGDALFNVKRKWDTKVHMKVDTSAANNCAILKLQTLYKFTEGDQLKRKFAEHQIPVVWVMGGPGSGKGTMCKSLASSERYTHLSVGDLVRKEVEKDPLSESSQLLKAVMERGDLLPNCVVLTFLARGILANIDHSDGFLIDGFPRNLKQAHMFQKQIKPPLFILSLKVNDHTMEQRALSRGEGRPDDNKETFITRLRVFHKEHSSIASNKKFSGKIIEVDAEGGKDQNIQNFKKAFHEAFASNSEANQPQPQRQPVQ